MSTNLKRVQIFEKYCCSSQGVPLSVEFQMFLPTSQNFLQRGRQKQILGQIQILIQRQIFQKQFCNLYFNRKKSLMTIGVNRNA